MLAPYRRHLDTCPHRHLGRAYTKCSCPIHVDGFVNGRRMRQSLETMNWDRARRRIMDLEADADGGKTRKVITEATEAFLTRRQVEASTETKYRRIVSRLHDFSEAEGIETIDQFTLEHLDAYRATRQLSDLSWSKELQFLRTFFAFCVRRKWCEDNPAKDMEMPRDPKPRPREPYTADEVARILAACDTFGRTSYERRRARAIILLMWRYGLRVSDVATLERERVRNGRIFLHAMKNGSALWLPLWPDVEMALQALPEPQGAPSPCRYYFWTGLGSKLRHIVTVDRTLQAVFLKSGVERGTAHRFRHTLATEILVNGGTIEDAANILGDSPAVVRKHYAKWNTAYQSRTVELLERIHGRRIVTPAARGVFDEITPLESGFMMVPEVGLEPTRPVKCAGF